MVNAVNNDVIMQAKTFKYNRSAFCAAPEKAFILLHSLNIWSE